MEDIKKSFGKKVKYYRLKNRLTQEQLSEKIGVTHNAIAAIECGKAFVSSGVLNNLCLVFKITPKELFETIDIQKESKDSEKIEEIIQMLNELTSKQVSYVHKIIYFLNHESI